MLDFFLNWLKQLILLVLLAAITDMLLPNTNMQKYARMVIGLLIILTLLSPILSIFNLNKFNDTILMNQVLLQASDKNQSFSEVEKQANEIKKANQQVILNQFSSMFKQEVAAEIKSRYEADVDVEVVLHINEDSEAIIDKIMVYLLGRVHKKDNKDNPYNPNTTIESIPAIEIKIGEEKVNETEVFQDEALVQTRNDIHKFLTSNYQLLDNQVEIFIQSGRN